MQYKLTDLSVKNRVELESIAKEYNVKFGKRTSDFDLAMAILDAQAVLDSKKPEEKKQKTRTNRRKAEPAPSPAPATVPVKAAEDIKPEESPNSVEAPVKRRRGRPRKNETAAVQPEVESSESTRVKSSSETSETSTWFDDS